VTAAEWLVVLLPLAAAWALIAVLRRPRRSGQSDDPSIAVGEVREHRGQPSNPFEEPRHRVTVLAVERGWVKYGYENVSSSARTEVFRKLYPRVVDRRWP
jgi:hypothetical protein